MIHDVDETLSSLIKREVLNGSNVEVSFEAPSREWAARRSGPALNLYLYDITEDLSRRDLQIQEVRDDRGRVVERRVPDKRFRLAYLTTAWTQRPQDEHRLLSAVLACFLRFDALPEELLKGSLHSLTSPARVTVGLPLPKDRQLSDIWSALGGELKPSLDVVVTAPFPAGRTFEVGELVTEGVALGLSGAPDQRESVAQVPPAAGAGVPPRAGIRRLPK